MSFQRITYLVSVQTFGRGWQSLPPTTTFPSVLCIATAAAPATAAASAAELGWHRRLYILMWRKFACVIEMEAVVTGYVKPNCFSVSSTSPRSDGYVKTESSCVKPPSSVSIAVKEKLAPASSGHSES